MKIRQIFLFVFVVSSLALMNKIDFVSTENRTDFIWSISPNSQMMVYKVKTPMVNASYVASRANTLFGFAGTIEENEESFVITEGNETFEMHKETGSIWYADYSKLWNISYEPTLPPPSTCKQTTDAFLTGNNLLPAEAFFATYGSTNATKYEVATTNEETKILDVQVKYGFEVETTEVYGPEAEISVYCGDGGEIIALAWAWRELEEFVLAEVYDLIDILNYYGIGINDVVDSSLVYYANSDEIYHGYLYPMYKLDLINVTANLDIEYIRYLPATDFSPRVKITNPVSSFETTEGDSIFFDCDVIDGNGSYTYSWESNIDGQISTVKSFDYSSLSIVTKNETSVSHTITVTVTDALGLICKDAIEINILAEPTSTASLRLFAFIFGGILFAGLLYYKKKRQFLVGSIALIFLFSLAVSPLMGKEISASVTITDVYSQQNYSPDSEEELEWEVGAEWCTYPNGKTIPNSDDCTKRFYNKFDSFPGWHKSFIYGNDQAWEIDFKDPVYTGRDTNYIDNLDIAYWTGHGGAYAFSFTTRHDFSQFSSSRARWGNEDLEWIALDTCQALKWSHDGRTAFTAWDDAFRGLHIICGFHSKCTDVKSRGSKFATYMGDGNRVINAWFVAGIRTESYKKYAAVLYATGSANPWLPVLNDPYFDHLWGFGFVSSDPYPWSHLVYLSSRC